MIHSYYLKGSKNECTIGEVQEKFSEERQSIIPVGSNGFIILRDRIVAKNALVWMAACSMKTRYRLGLIIPIACSEVLLLAVSKSQYSKFDPYLFNTTGLYTHTKEKLFAQWGYTVDDAKWLQAEMERQALEKYLAGDYTLGKLNKDGQRISIRIEIPRKTGEGTVSFISGWMVYPNGHVQLTTPYGGK